MAVNTSKNCVCDDLLLKPLPSLDWRSNHQTWYARQRRGQSWIKNIIKDVCSYAGTSQVYTNSTLRPSNITELHLAGYGHKEIAQFTDQKCESVVAHYNKTKDLMSEEEKRDARMLLNPSGRRALRGGPNLWGETSGSGPAYKVVGEQHKEKVQKKAVMDKTM